MPKYAIVRFLDEKTEPLVPFVNAQMRSRWNSHKRSTMVCSEVPAIKDFLRFVSQKKIRHISAFTHENAIAFRDWLSGLFASPYTVRHKIAVVSAIFATAVLAGKIDRNPFHGLDLPRLEFKGRALSDAEIRVILGLLPLYVRRAFIFSLYTGLRSGEIRGLCWWQIQGSTLLIPAVSAKSGKPRTVHLHPRALAILGPRKKPKDFVFCGYDENALSATNLTDNMLRAAARAKIGRVRFHDARHTWATRFYEATGDLKALMDQGGWAHVDSVMVYQHMTPTRVMGNLRLGYKRI